MKGAFSRLLTIATVLTMLVIVWDRGGRAFADPSQTAGNTEIINAASASWQDTTGNSYQILSNQVVVNVQGVSAIAVTPKESTVNPSTDGYAAASNVTRTFTITNASNISDAYKITAFAADKGNLVSLAFVTPGGPIPITVGSTVSPTVAAGSSIAVQAVISTNGIAVGTSFALHLTAQTTVTGTANGLQSDSGEQWLIAATAPTFTGPAGGNTPISKTVDHEVVVQSQGGAVVLFDIVVKNAGGTPATNAVMTDTIPAGLTPDLTTVKINGNAVANAALSGQTLTVPLGTLPAGSIDDISFNSQIVSATTLGTTYVNVAAVSADGIAPLSTTPAAVLIGTANIVFDPSNNNAPVQGSVVSLLDANNQLVPLSNPAGSPGYRGRSTTAASANTANPYTTGADGTYGFALQASQIAAGSTTFYITIQTPGYLNRRIKVIVTPASVSGLYDTTSTSLDNQPLAAAGSYSLTTSAVALHDIFGLFGNLPLFKTQTIALDKTVDRTSASAGDRLTYTIDVSNPSGSSLGGVQVVDTLPSGEAYAPGSALVDGHVLEPNVDGRTLTWSIPLLVPGVRHTIVYAAIVYPSVPAGTILTNSATAGAIIAGTHVNVNASANAEVIVTQGALGDRSVITGRVFADSAHTGHFKHGDSGIAGVRVFLEDGTSATTDLQGRFSFPSVRPGMHVIRIDKTTLPDGLHGGELQKLVHGVLDDGLMQDIEFAVSAGT